MWKHGRVAWQASNSTSPSYKWESQRQQNREFTDTMLDGMSVKELEEKLNAKVHVNHGPQDLIKLIGEIQ